MVWVFQAGHLAGPIGAEGLGALSLTAPPLIIAIAFGLAMDFNVPENQRGTPGEMNRTVVQIFKDWGFAWGGDWHYTDPMHFELASIVKPG